MVLPCLQAIEAEQRKMLGVIEALSKRARGVAHGFSELKARKELAARHAAEAREQRRKRGERRSMLPATEEEDYA